MYILKIVQISFIFFFQCVNTENVEITMENTLSPSWMENYFQDGQTCETGIGKYDWQRCGLGYNMNTIVNSWLYSLVVKKWKEFSLVISEEMFQELECFDESGGEASRGWNCLFEEIPHLCVFNSKDEWKNSLISSNVSDEDIYTTTQLKPVSIFNSYRRIQKGLDELNIGLDHMGALAVLTKNIWDHLAPWTRRDVDSVTNSDSFKVFQESPFLGLHVRRGDKLSTHEATLIPLEEYFKSAINYLNESKISVDDIAGIWLASDDPTVISETRELASVYFPNIHDDLIVHSSANKKQEAETTSVSQGYRSFVYLISDLEQLSKAEVFVGTFSSNLGRHVATMREVNGKPRSSSRSADSPWVPG